MHTKAQLKYWNSMKGQKGNALGKKWSKKSREKLSLSKKKQPISVKQLEYWKSMKGTPAIKFTKEIRNKISNALMGDKNPSWCGGHTIQYGKEFTSELKNIIRKRDNYICLICGIEEINCRRNLSIHHIDYNKYNNKYNNLISLCDSCHMKTNFNRKRWKKFFSEDKMKKDMDEDEVFLKEVNNLDKIDEDVDKTIIDMASIWKYCCDKFTEDNICFMCKKELSEDEKIDIIKVPKKNVDKGLFVLAAVCKTCNK